MNIEQGPSQINQIISKAKQAISTQVYGHQDTSAMLAGAMLIGGHVLLEGPPGVGKTLLAKTFAHVTGLNFQRIQFTPDLMPSDITGVYIFDQDSGGFRLSQGPIFADIILADEINRTPPKTQSALLEAMQEHFVTIDGKKHPLGELFFVIATQNPIEHEGTYPLPEAQLDRFLFKLNLGYPGDTSEIDMISEFSSERRKGTNAGENEERLKSLQVLSAEELTQGRTLLRQISLSEEISQYIFDLANASRSHSDLILGASPRAALNLALAAKLSAAMDERFYVIPDDVQRMCPYVFTHRLILKPDVLDFSDSSERVVEEILKTVAIPTSA